MADIFQDAPELYAEEHALQRRQKIAEALALQAQAPLATPPMAAGYVVPISPFAGMAKLLNGYTAGRDMAEADAGMKGLAAKKTQMIADEIMRNQQMANGTPAQPALAAPADELGGGPARPETAAVAGNPRQAAINAMLSQFPQVQKYGALMVNDQNRKEDKQTAIDQRNFEMTQKAQERLDQIRLQESERRISKAEADARSADIRRELAAQQANIRREIAGNRHADAGKPPSGFRFTPNGDLERIPGGPADIKAEAELSKKVAGAGDVDIALGTLRDAYDRLEKGGGITSTANGPIDNMTANVASSGLGQTVGKMFGTNNQSARNDIAMSRPALLAALMKATGMSAKQMDSNAELKLWLSTATDPTLDVESNRRALDNIEKKYIGAGKTAAPAATAAPAGGYGAPPPGAVRAKSN